MKKLLYFLLFSTCIVYGQKPKVIAHRGGSSMAPENTVAAFTKATEINADYYELDVQLSSDDSLMIMHDATVDRTTNGTGSIASMTYAQLRQLDAGSWFGPEFAGEKIPTLREALAVAKNSSGNIGIVVELKSSETTLAPKTVAVIQSMGLQNRVIVSSFTLSLITQVKSIDPTIPVQIFASPVTNSVIDQMVAINGEWVGSGSGFDQSVIDYAHTSGIKYNAWTINSASQMLPLIDQGVDAITTDYPSTMISIMDDTPPSDVVLLSATANETAVTLVWNEAEDLQSSIAGYDIFRTVSSTLVIDTISVGTDTTYVDQTYTESEGYFYKIKAKNNAGLSSANYSNEIFVVTGTDVTKPYVMYLTSKGDSTTVLVEFNERVDKVKAETITNYSINHDISVLNAKLSLDQKTVILTTSPMAQQSYTITVKNVTDKATVPNKMVTKSLAFLHQSMLTGSVGIYNLDSIYFQAGDSLIMDASGNSNNGVVLNGAFIGEGYLGNALSFDGVDDYVQFQPSTSFDINTSAVTVSLWTKLDYVPVDLPSAYGPLFDSETDQYVMYEDRGNSELRFKVTTSVSAERPGIPNSDLKAGEWINLVGVYDGTNVMIYLNGVKKDSHALTGTVKTGQAATLGKSGTSYFQGEMDQVEVYNRALSEEEILEKYNTKATPVSFDPSPVVLESAVVHETDVTLTWSASVNYESNLMYQIYRDVNPEPTLLYATVGDTTGFTDKTNVENQKYYYRVAAKNTRGLISDYSNEIEATTGIDATRPKVVYSTSRGDTSNMIIEFNEKVDQASAEAIANYSIDQSVTVLGAKLAVDQKSVFITTTKLEEQTYVMTINNILDLATVPNMILKDTKIKITHENDPENLVAWYKLNELPVSGNDTLVIDATANANDGVTKNLPVLDEGLLGNSLKFDGTQSQYVQFEASPSFDINDTMVTVSVWTKLTYLPVEMPMAYGPLFDAQGDQYVIYADKGNNELRFKVATSGGAERPGIPTADLVTGQWINVVGVYNGSTVKVYLNGVLEDSHNLTGTVNSGIIPMLGKSGTTGTISYLTGSIDNVEVFKAALTEAEVLDMYVNYKAVVENDCESYDLTEDATACSGETYIFPDGTTGDSDMVHVSYLKSLYGCDSTITTTLTFYSVDVSVVQNGDTLTAGATGATYQWLDCDNGNTAIAGATSSQFIPTVTGNYAVKVTENECTDTSECINVVVNSIKSELESKVQIYPNPNNGQFTIDLTALSTTVLKVEIINAQGQVVYERESIKAEKWIVQLPPAQKGLYVVHVFTKSDNFCKRLLIN